MSNERDITMTVKMNNKCFPDIEKLARGERADESQIAELLAFIDRRYDCADFRMVCILRSLYDFPHLLSGEMAERMRRTVLGFKYWMDEAGGAAGGGDDSICWWSENHQLLFAACEYLAGQLYPAAIFPNSGMSGEQHRLKAKKRLEYWFETRFALGFIEWHSNTYYEEDAAPLSLLIDCAADTDIAQKATMLLDLLLADMALHCFEGFFCASSGRCYEAQKTRPAAQDVTDILEKAFGFKRLAGAAPQYDYSRLSADFIINRNYVVPKAMYEIAHCKKTAEIRTSMGLDLDEVAAHFPNPRDMKRRDMERRDMERRGMYLWAMESFTNTQSANLTLRIFNHCNLKTNDFLKNISLMNIPVLRELGLIPLIIRILNPVTAGIAIQRSNTCTWRSSRYMLSSAQRYHPGEFGDQQHIWQATLSGGVSVFTTHPGAAFFEDNARNFSPSYWVGNGILPHAAQYQNTLLCMYDLRVRKGFLEKKRQWFTHAWFPQNEFDQTVLESRLAAGKRGETYIALVSAAPLEKRSETELAQQGKVTAWAALPGSAEEDGSWEQFLAKARAAPLTLRGKILSLEWRGHSFTLHYKKQFRVDGIAQSANSRRLESPFGNADANSGVFELKAADSRLRLDWPTLRRETE
jgi:hypothetical protein